ncbi:hypothetical protein W911_12055 [Hyphomicrobium nitrativorans NL23]|uniref:Uncharacterized protein n=1 Tax=Hyphomicrobium nitrativorans NL23 TaxID=1029756 RepID=V5SEL7_9HYPH|nr:hypothetical protein [Hyphomicrobium nitrativorans]AHB48973.1 hypothetical protein W911_12055 [Hyphomicrobium nitrativorans NL23]
MTLFLDTEFNGFGGALISIALVSDNGGRESEFYGVRELPDQLAPWVEANVLPVLGKKPEPDTVLRRRLVEFLHGHAGQTIIADWPEDLIHCLGLLCPSPGRAYRINLNLRLIKATEELPSEVPHNALSDARALMRWYQSGAT